MKQYRVIVLPEAVAEILDDFLYIKSQSKQNAHDWLDKLYDHVYSLETMPERYGVARENEAFEEEVHCLRHFNHRILYTVDHELSVVRVHAVMHGSRDDLQGDEF